MHSDAEAKALFFFLFPSHFLLIFSGGSSHCQLPSLAPVSFDPHPLEARDLPAVSGSACLPPSPLLPTGWLMPAATPCLPLLPVALSGSSAGPLGPVQGLSKRAGRTAVPGGLSHTQPALSSGRELWFHLCPVFVFALLLRCHPFCRAR